MQELLTNEPEAPLVRSVARTARVSPKGHELLFRASYARFHQFHILFEDDACGAQKEHAPLRRSEPAFIEVNAARRNELASHLTKLFIHWHLHKTSQMQDIQAYNAY